MEKYHTGLSRFTALIIDGLILLPVDWIHQIIWKLNPPVLGFFVWVSIYSSIFVVYYIYMHARFGQTIGKWVCKVRVVDYVSEKSISIRQAILRDIIPVLLVPYSIYVYTASYSGWYSYNLLNQNTFDSILRFSLTFWVLLEMLSMLTNKKRRAVHDYIANTVVVRVPNKSIQPTAEASAD